jgi:PPOX class probable F420-dependent enzyme
MSMSPVLAYLRYVVVGTLEELPAWASELLLDARVAHLGLLDGDGRPRVLPVTYAVVDGVIWSAIDQKPKSVPGADLARVRWLRTSPHAALTVDRYDDDWSKLAWVQVLGTVSIEDVRDDVVGALARRYPAYRDQAPGGPLLRLSPERVLWWRAVDTS